jgi:hypothetical protein
MASGYHQDDLDIECIVRIADQWYGSMHLRYEIADYWSGEEWMNKLVAADRLPDERLIMLAKRWLR